MRPGDDLRSIAKGVLVTCLAAVLVGLAYFAYRGLNRGENSATSPVATPAPIAEASATPNIVATATRAAEIAQIATLTAPKATIPAPTAVLATATPAIQTAFAALKQGSTATIEGVYRVTIIEQGANPQLASAKFTIRVENLTKADLRFTACSFLLRDGKGEDSTPLACSNPSRAEEILIAAGGSSTVVLTFPYNQVTGVQGIRFSPTVPANTMVFFAGIP